MNNLEIGDLVRVKNTEPGYNDLALVISGPTKIPRLDTTCWEIILSSNDVKVTLVEDCLIKIS